MHGLETKPSWLPAERQMLRKVKIHCRRCVRKLHVYLGVGAKGRQVHHSSVANKLLVQRNLQLLGQLLNVDIVCALSQATCLWCLGVGCAILICPVQQLQLAGVFVATPSWLEVCV